MRANIRKIGQIQIFLIWMAYALVYWKGFDDVVVQIVIKIMARPGYCTLLLESAHTGDRNSCARDEFSALYRRRQRAAAE